MRKLLLTSAAIVVSIAIQGIPLNALAKDVAKLPFTLNWKFYGIHGNIFLAVDRGYFKDEGIDPQIVAGDGSSNVVNRLASGAYDIGLGDISSVIKFNEKNPDKQVKAVFQDAPADIAIMTLKRTGIMKPMDLHGRVVGAPLGDTAYRMFGVFEKATGVSREKITWEHMQANLRDAMLAQGKVDAITANMQTAFFNLKGAGFKTNEIVFMPYSKFGIDLVNIGLMATDKIISERPEIVAGVVRAVTRGYLDALKDPEAAMEALLKRDPLLKRDIEYQRWLVNMKRGIDSKGFAENGLGFYSKSAIEGSIALVTEAEKLATKLEPDDVYTMKFLPSADERKVPQAVLDDFNRRVKEDL